MQDEWRRGDWKWHVFALNGSRFGCCPEYRCRWDLQASYWQACDSQVWCLLLLSLTVLALIGGRLSLRVPPASRRK